MNNTAIAALSRSIRQAGRIRRNEARAARITRFKPADVRKIRAKLGQSQEQFATMIGVSVATLRNWEQGRRTPDGPALALLRVTESNPRAVANALNGRRRGVA